MNEYKNWQKLVSRKANILAAENIMMGYTSASFKELLDIDCGFSEFRYINFGAYVSKKDFFSFVGKVQKRVKKDPGFIRWVIEENNKQCDRLIKAADISGINLRESTKKDLLLLLQKYIKEFHNMGPFWAVPFAVEKIGSGIISGELKRKLGKSEKDLAKDYFLTLTSPLKESYVGQEQREFLQLAEKIKNAGYSLKDKKLRINLKKHKTIWDDITSHISRYCWLSFQYMIGKPWTIDDFLLRLMETENPKDGLRKLSAEKKELEQKVDKIIKKLGFSKQTREIVEAVREYVFLRTHRKDITTLGDYKIRPLLKEIGRRFGFSFEEITYHTSGEIYSLLKTGRKVKKEAIKSRKRDFAILATKRKTKVLIGDELANYKDFWGGEEIERDVKEIKGVTASRGYGKGKARILVDRKLIPVFKKGEVLVTTMTTPDFVPAMKKAVAIVTDEGGILCHAAIISREFGIPCVIATKTATKILKDGDLVEVDADEAIVRKLPA